MFYLTGYTNLSIHLTHLTLRTVFEEIIFLTLLIGNPQLSQIPPLIGSPHLGQFTIVSFSCNPRCDLFQINIQCFLHVYHTFTNHRDQQEGRQSQPPSQSCSYFQFQIGFCRHQCISKRPVSLRVLNAELTAQRIKFLVNPI